MNHLLYILHSPTKDKFYVGETEDFDKRLELHRSKQFTHSYTAKQADDWEVFLTVECQSRNHARKVEEFIIKSKSFLSLFLHGERQITNLDFLQCHKIQYAS